MKNFFISVGEVYNDRIGMVRMMIVPAIFTILFSLDLSFYFTCFLLSFFFSVTITTSELKQQKLEEKTSDEQTVQKCEQKQEKDSSINNKE